jgi:hypothetical protein
VSFRCFWILLESALTSPSKVPGVGYSVWLLLCARAMQGEDENGAKATYWSGK